MEKAGETPAFSRSRCLIAPTAVARQRLLARFSDDADLAGRLVAFYPLFGLKWCVILLNEFLPEHFLRRQFAACGGGERQAVLQAQLAKARTMLQRIAREHEHFPYLT